MKAAGVEHDPGCFRCNGEIFYAILLPDHCRRGVPFGVPSWEAASLSWNTGSTQVKGVAGEPEALQDLADTSSTRLTLSSPPPHFHVIVVDAPWLGVPRP